MCIIKMKKLSRTPRFVFLVLFVLVNDLGSSFLIVERVENLVESRIALLVVEEIDKRSATNRVRLAFGAMVQQRRRQANKIQLHTNNNNNLLPLSCF